MGGYCRVLGKKELGAGRGGRGLDSYNLGCVRPCRDNKAAGMYLGKWGAESFFSHDSQVVLQDLGALSPTRRPTGAWAPPPQGAKTGEVSGVPIYSSVSTQLSPSWVRAEQVSSTLFFPPPHARLPFNLSRAQVSNTSRAPSLDPGVTALRPPDNAGVPSCCANRDPERP